MKRKTTDAVEILKRRTTKDPELKELYEEEKINLQAALAIRRARETAGLTQGQLAEKIGTTQSVISRLEDAEYEGHTLKMLERIAEVLDQRVIIHLEAKTKVEKAA
jgi:ribosome-binding protein aMBF1 (putative translation factor)